MSNSSLEHDPISLGRRSFESEEDVVVAVVVVVVRSSTVSSSVVEVDDDWIALIDTIETLATFFRPLVAVKAVKAEKAADVDADDDAITPDLITRKMCVFICGAETREKVKPKKKISPECEKTRKKGEKRDFTLRCFFKTKQLDEKSRVFPKYCISFREDLIFVCSCE